MIRHGSTVSFSSHKKGHVKNKIMIDRTVSHLRIVEKPGETSDTARGLSEARR